MTPLAADAWRKRRFVVVVAFEDDDRGRFAMVRHRHRGWELPGGGIDGHETPEEAARREFLEETGRPLIDARLILTQDRGFGTGWVFAGQAGPVQDHDERRPEEDIVEVRFVTRLHGVEPLAFPDDPYEEIGKALGRPLM